MEVMGRIADRVPWVPITVLDRSLEACLDTGFNAELMIPQRLAKELGLEELYEVMIETADGKEASAPAKCKKSKIALYAR